MTDLIFTKNERGRYVATFKSEGAPVVLQLNREDKGSLTFFANIGNMSPMLLQSLSDFYAGAHFMRVINVPANVIVTIESETRVTEGGYE